MNPHNIPTLSEVKSFTLPPDWLVELTKQTITKTTYTPPTTIPKGERKTHMHKFGSKLRAAGMEIDEIRPALEGFVQRFDEVDDKTDTAIEDVLKSIAKYPKGSKPKVEPTKEQVSDTAGKDYVLPLGHQGNDYFFTSNSNRQIVTISASGFSLNSLLNLQPYDYWQENFAKTATQIDIHTAFSFLMREARDAGIFSSGKLRGRGVWRDKGRSILHAGNYLVDLQSRSTHQLGRIKTDYIYELCESYQPSFTKTGTDKDVLALCQLFNWKSKNAPYMLAGWLCIARLCGALKWRPHLWITGQKGTGKSTVINEFVKYFVGPQSYFFEGGSSAAGIRQEVRCDAVPIIFDEAETSDTKSGAKIKSVLELARQASSDSDGYICKGTPTGKGIKYKMSSVFCLASIRVNLQEEQDKSRFTILELAKNDTDNWPKIQKMLSSIGIDDGENLFFEMSALIEELYQNITVFSNCLSEFGLERRLADQYGALLAGLYTYNNKKVADTVGAMELISHIDLTELLQTAESDYTDADDCMSTILQSRSSFNDTDNAKLTIDELIVAARNSTDKSYEKELSRYGIAVEGKYIFIANKNTELAKLLRDSPWANFLWKDSLLRLEGSTQTKKRIGGHNIRVVRVVMDDEVAEVPF